MRLVALVRQRPSQAITATARKLAVLVYHVLKGNFVYRDPGADAYDTQQRARVLRHLRHRANRLGFALVSHETGEIVAQRLIRWAAQRLPLRAGAVEAGECAFA